MACCNLAESFENSASVSVGYGAGIDTIEEFANRMEELYGDR